MYAELETNLRTHLAGAVSGATVFGSMDFVDFSDPDNAPVIAVQVLWRGFDPGQRKQDALMGEHQFAVVVTLVGVRAKATERAAVQAGMLTIHQRLITWRPYENQPDAWAEFENGQVVEQGAVWQYQINITLPRAVVQP